MNKCVQMRNGSLKMSIKLQYLMLLCLILQLKQGFGIRFVIDREECLSHNVEYEGDIVHVSFVIVKSGVSWHYGDEGVDLVIKGPTDEQIHDFHDKISGIYEFIAQQRGVYRFCFMDMYGLHETVDFDVHVSHYMSYDPHARDEHFNPMLDQITKLEEALYSIQFEQHWLEAQTVSQALANEVMSQKAIYKAIFESIALVGASFLQVFLLQRLLDRKLGTYRA
ncbi:hypothetical protein BUALT_Bualt03G0225900 [Buddleja alternifolia]|uniref:GOLD domain-containing protein n=1 Tax=Buddleja alternifolia TaxID=168488 RepID=A0AAV6XXE4_9LAMI|nr:hypothetical protein BUALT_Bualt03G0225900 [Buddleja alternifolia]